MANEFARRLRKNMTVDELKLWDELRLLRKRGFHFRKQAPLGPYIVDFVCFSAKLVIEVDGVQHNSTAARAKDAVRDAFLAGEGFKVLRFTNGEVTNTLDGVMLEVLEALGLAVRPPTRFADGSLPTQSADVDGAEKP